MRSTEIYACSSCGYESPKWAGQCPSCQEWGTVAESKQEIFKKSIRARAESPTPLHEILAGLNAQFAFPTGIGEFDRVLGGGICSGSLTLLTGEPGIGKSTLTLQLANQFARAGKKVLYISGEESIQQIAQRAKRLRIEVQNLTLLEQTNVETIIATAAKHSPDVVIIDSIQVMSSSQIQGQAGSPAQVRLSTEVLLDFAKPRQMSVILIGHVTKDGTLAGPRVLEHLVDTVLYFEGERNEALRILRCVKNRFGSTQEVGIFGMSENGLTEITDIEKIFVHGHAELPIGTALTATIEGTRPLIIEVQALTNKTVFGYPKRTASGFDLNRLNLLLAVLERHCNLRLSEQDVYINVASGYRIQDPGCDLAICLAIASSFLNKILAPRSVHYGEIGLSGEIRMPKNPGIEKEMKKRGYTLTNSVGKLSERLQKLLG